MNVSLRGGLALAVITAIACTSPAATTSPETNGARASLPPGFPVGSWTNTLTGDDLRAAGVSDPADLRQAGPQTLTFSADGTWTHVSPNARPDPVFRGRIVVTGADKFEMHTIFPTELVGEVVTIRWRVENGALLLDTLDAPHPVITAQMEAHPWSPAH